ncbi:LysR family transcriptional regulator [Novosphingobium sp. 9]|uniref:LysR family transcriptional regulator n=1 Tax=Novosphingobium sp. 9 TaxID=2025349 RepID=UPI0021B52A2E|nr:LysR family transcriptional regulator [Novosphingobium sp. 9]
MTSDRLTGIEVFVRAVRKGGLSAAARELRMSPAMASKHLNALEARLGVTLLHRSTRKLSLTAEGEAYLDRAERLLADFEEAEAEAAARSGEVRGLLRVSAPAAFGVLHMAPLVASFAHAHPAVTVELGLDDRFVDLLAERWDVAVRIGHLAESTLLARKLAPVRMSICASPDYLSRRGRPAGLDDLAAHDCLGYTLGALTGAVHWGFGPRGERQVPVNGSLHANNGEVLVRAALAGQGLVYGPRFFVAAHLERGALEEIDLGEPLLDLGAIHTVTHPARRPAARTRAFVAHLAMHIPQAARDW